MQVEEAPAPSEVFWRNVGLPNKARRTGSLLSTVATIALCLFWTIPVGFISSLTEVNSLKVKLPRLGEMIENSPALEMGLAVLAPLLLLLLNESVLPVILKWFAQWEGHISSPRLEASLFRKLAAFQVIQVKNNHRFFFVIVDTCDGVYMCISFVSNFFPAHIIYSFRPSLSLQFLEVSRLNLQI